MLCHCVESFSWGVKHIAKGRVCGYWVGFPGPGTRTLKPETMGVSSKTTGTPGQEGPQWCSL